MRWNIAACGLMGLFARSATAITMGINDERKDPKHRVSSLFAHMSTNTAFA